MRPRPRLVLAGVLAALAAVAPSARARQEFDRTKVPPPGPAPVLRVPGWTRTTLTNGADLIVVQKSDLPLVSFNITFLGGANQFEPAIRRGVGALTASMLSEGTTTRDGEALSNALQLLGTGIGASVRGETASMGLTSTSARFDPTLEILADMLLHSTFPAEALERLRGQRLVALAQARAQPNAIASRVFPRLLFGSAHPYGRQVTEDTLKAITREDVVVFHDALFQPGRALVTVVGAVEPSAAKATIERALGPWLRGGEKPSFSYPPLPAPRPTTIYLVDKPDAAQSVLVMGNPGPPRRTPDFYALEVTNTILGEMFQSRLNANIREEKGYSYGVSSDFAYGKGPGPFRAGGDIVTEKTAAALVEFIKELRGMQGAKPITDDELTTGQNALVQRLPAMFDSVSGINGAISALWVEELPDDYYQQYEKNVSAVTKNDVLRVAKQYIDLDHLTIVVVGDRASIEKPLQDTKIAPVVVLDVEGNTIDRK
jgi:zinc protease